MKTGTDAENWRSKYFDGLSALEQEREQARAMQNVLKRLAGRLCTATLGMSPALDHEVRKLQAALRRDATCDEFEKITPALTSAIQGLDQLATQPVAAWSPAMMPGPSATAVSPTVMAPAPAVDERIRAILSALLTQLRRDASLVAQADALDATLTDSMTQDQLQQAMVSLADMVDKRIHTLETARQEVEALLSHMVGKLDEIGRFAADQHHTQSRSQASSETLNVQLADEMKAIGESVESADDLQQLRNQVRSRIDSIDRHLQAFREREARLTEEMRTRSEQMNSRIAALETQARRLHTQLQAEQKLSTIDVLTGIPNRLAYDKRVAEELERFKRFNQPTCIAVWDVDHFKRVNDTYGHRAGDRVLRAVADCFAARIRSTDFVARYGGEEFITLFPGTRLEDSVQLVDELRGSIEQIGFHFRGSPVPITVSGGITAFRSGDSPTAAFDRADKALYKAKAEGRNRCVSA
ncbi:MAG TPA: diguanylate cyclase [Povalibacter sp.]|nr:diguanylate cyclase [Povalibacter sp.]